MNEMKRVHVLVVAAGNSTRMGGVSKVFLPLLGEPVLARSVKAFLCLPQTVSVTVAVRPGEEDRAKDVLQSLPVTVVAGGKERADSVRNGVAAIGDVQPGDLLAVHDGARPLVSKAVIEAAIQGVSKGVGAVPAVPVKDTVKVAGEDGRVESTPPRDRLFAVQTPQCFLFNEYREAMETAPYGLTDDAGVFEAAGKTVRLTQGDYGNLKITTPSDLPLAESLLRERGEKEETPMVRIGHGYDVHRLIEGRPLILCGVTVPYEKGLLGHSDADVAVHAVMDALLGALALPDIGRLFPDNDPTYAGADSMKLLEKVMARVTEEGYRVGNLDVTVLAQKPKLAPFVPSMKENLAAVCKVPLTSVNVKATTEEGLGFTGSLEGMAAHCVCLLEKN